MSSDSGSDSDSFGPALPPHLAAAKKAQPSPPQPPPQQQQRRRPVAGPAAPPPPGYVPPSSPPPTHTHSDDDDDDVLGPMPPPPAATASLSSTTDLDDRIAEFEERARRAREEDDARKRPEKLERGDWMLVPPEAHRLLPMLGDSAMKSRQFSKKAVGEDIDQSGWTETPEQKAKKSGEKRKRAKDDGPRIPTREELQTAEFIRKHNETHRGGALLEKHMKTALKDRKFDAEDVSKRPFDRDRDMGGSRKIDTKSRQQMVEQARKLDTKFGHGNKTFL
ncbi:hypothetical protein HDU87_000896 [Geranomyces variabilis]|uniref:DUF3752 domain-containing protein n=1 Tax=Geranomyces variabilis TaxID=109894 RepID=A0AAD5XIF8_9FUNG|nr:hypothetical protein HDU87_000896 [Geranomyces variabilis]